MTEAISLMFTVAMLEDYHDKLILENMDID